MSDSNAAFIGRGAPAATPHNYRSQNGTGREITFIIPGTLGGKGRPKFSTIGKFPRAYTPLKTRSDEAVVRQFAHEALDVELEGIALIGPLELTIHVQRVTPQSWTKGRKAKAKWITGKPDIDNSAKLIMDAMNGIVYTDDAQIAVLATHRTYGPINSVEIHVAELT